MAPGCASVLRGLAGSNMLVGRDRECEGINDLTTQKKSIIIFGEEGVGKTAVIRKVLEQKEPRKFLYSKASATLKEALLNLALPHAGSERDVRKKDTRALKRMFYRILDQSPEYVVFDQIAWVGPKYYAFLDYIMSREIPLIVLTRHLDKRSVGHLWLALYNFAKVEIANLDKPRAEELIDACVTSLGLKIGRDDDFKKEIFSISRGNPKIIGQLCSLARDEKYRAKGYIDVRLMDLDRRINESII